MQKSRFGALSLRTRDSRYQSAYIFGAVCPGRGATAALVTPQADTAAMSAHLVDISKAVAKDAHAILLPDGAGWHCAKTLQIPDNMTLLPMPPYLPPYSPDLNPIEQAFSKLKSHLRKIGGNVSS